MYHWSRKGGETTSRGRQPSRQEPPLHDDKNFFNLTTFEKTFRTTSRDRSRAGNVGGGVYDGRTGFSTRGPEKHGPQPSDQPFGSDLDIDDSDMESTGPELVDLEGVGLKKMRLGDLGETTVIAAYNGSPLKDQVGRNVGVVTNGTWFVKAWRMQSDGKRVTNGPTWRCLCIRHTNQYSEKSWLLAMTSGRRMNQLSQVW